MSKKFTQSVTQNSSRRSHTPQNIKSSSSYFPLRLLPDKGVYQSEGKIYVSVISLFRGIAPTESVDRGKGSKLFTRPILLYEVTWVTSLRVDLTNCHRFFYRCVTRVVCFK